MPTLDQRMAECPLKHEIRSELWNKYVSKIDKADKKYLTLYSPPLMDVKYLNKQGHIRIEGYKYVDVVGVYLPDVRKENYTQIISEGSARIGYLIEGDINDNDVIKALKDYAPYDIVNLDYCNYLYGNHYSPYISSNMHGIEEIIKMQSQNRISEFVLFITSRIDPSDTGFANKFLTDLKKLINDNRDTYVDWGRDFKTAFNDLSSNEFMANQREDFITVGLTKMAAIVLARNGYKIVDADAYRLVRDNSNPVRDLLHLAFHVKSTRGNRRRISQYTQASNHEKESKIILNKYTENQIIILQESIHEEALFNKHGEIIGLLNKENFELPTPEPIDED